MTSLTGSMALSLSNLYVKNYFREDSKDAALTMVKYITNEFLKMLKVRQLSRSADFFNFIAVLIDQIFCLVYKSSFFLQRKISSRNTGSGLDGSAHSSSR